MDSLSASSSTSDRAKAVEELLKGRDLALQLRHYFPISSSKSEDLVMKILGSFTNTISILTNQSHDLSIKHEDSTADSSINTSSIAKPKPKDKRGSYKRRKYSDSWMKESAELVDDGYAWRKYGQKVILNSKHPRNYFRCTHKLDQGCMATKQVQRIQDNPPLFRTTYSGQHTCKNLLKSPMFADFKEDTSTSPLISFANNSNNVNLFGGLMKRGVNYEAECLLSHDHEDLNAAFDNNSSCTHIDNFVGDDFLCDFDMY